MNENHISGEVIKTIFEIYKEIGPGLLESVYEEIMFALIKEKGLRVQRQAPIPVRFQKKELPAGYRADLIVEEKVIVEIKSVEELHPVHFKQLLTYLKLADMKLGLLINFNVYNPRDGIRRVVNGL